ncbi:MAG: MFS transporter [Thermoplasmata archaeon]
MEDEKLSLDSLPLSNFHIKMLLLSAAGVFLDGYDLFIISVALLFIKPLWLNSSLGSPNTIAVYTGLLASSALIGMFIGAVTLGHFTDKYGRKAMYVIDLIFFVIFGFLSAISQNIFELILFRILLGIGIGADYPISSTYISEFAPAKYRGRIVSLTFMFWGIGSLSAAAVGLSMVSLGPDAWRWMLFSGVLPAIVVILLRTRMPESPRWLISKGERQKANAVINDLETKAGVAKSVERDTFKLSDTDKVKASMLLSPFYIRRTIFSWLPWFFMDIAVYGIGIFLPTILQGLGFKTHFASIEGTALLDIFGIVGFIIAMLLIDRVGRLKLQAFGFLGMAFSLLILAFAFPTTVFLMFVLFAIFQVSMNAGPNTTTWVIAAELFPTRLRATGQGTSTAFSRMGAITGVFLLPIIMELFGIVPMLLFVSIAAILGLALTVSLGEETKNLSLEDASMLFREFSKLIDELLTNMKASAKELYEMVSSFDNLNARQKKIRAIEHENDEVVHNIFNKLNRSLSAPIDVIDIAALSNAIDDIIDLIEATSNRIVIYEIKENTPEMIALTEIIVKATDQLEMALKEIRKIRIGDYQDIIIKCKEIHTLENYADDILDSSLGELFKQSDPINVLKLKEIYEYLEAVTDKCEDVADVIMDLTVKYS